MTGKGRFLVKGIATIIVMGTILTSVFLFHEQAIAAETEALEMDPGIITEEPSDEGTYTGGADEPADESGVTPAPTAGPDRTSEDHLEDNYLSDAGRNVGGLPWELGMLVFVLSSSAALAVLYARLSTDDVLEGPRKDIYEHIENNPGDHLAGIMKTMGISSSSARHHLEVLEWSEMVVSHKSEKFRHYYPNRNGYRLYTSGHGYKEVISALRNRTAREIVKQLMDSERSNQKELAGALGLHPSTVNWHAGRLMAAGIVSRERDGKDIHYILNAEMDLAKVMALIEGDAYLAGAAPAAMETASG